MSLNQQSVVYDIQALKVYALATADNVGGASPTYSAGVACQGVADATLTPSIVSAELKGDGGRIISRFGRTEMLELTATYGRLGIDAIQVMLGGTVTDVGSGVSEVVTWSLSMPNLEPYFKVEFQILNTDNGVGSINVSLYKCSLKSATFTDSKTDGYGQPKFDVEAIPLNSTGVIGQIAMYATATSLD